MKNNQQVETVGDKYMAVSGLPDECENHAVSIARLALDMIDKADSVKMGNQPIVSRDFYVGLWLGLGCLASKNFYLSLNFFIQFTASHDRNSFR